MFSRLDPKLLFAAAVTSLAMVVAFVRASHPAPPAFAMTTSAPQAVFSHATAAATSLVVYVTGGVPHPGNYRLPAGARIADALQRAGGATSDADLEAIDLAQPAHDGDMVLVPRRASALDLARVAALGEGPGDAGAAADNTRSTTHRKHRHKKHRRASSSSSPEADVASAAGDGNLVASRHSRKHRRHRRTADRATPETLAHVRLNSASEDELQTLPGIGPELAARIVAFRNLNGPFASADELLDVAGVTDSKLAALEPYLDID